MGHPAAEAAVLGGGLMTGLKPGPSEAVRDCEGASFVAMSSGEIAVHLRRLYDEVLGVGPFPTGECRSIRMSDIEHLDLVMWLADIAGIASHGERLTTITEARRSQFKLIAATGFFAQQSRLVSRVTQEKTPMLWVLLHSSEQARLLIHEFLREPKRGKAGDS